MNLKDLVGKTIAKSNLMKRPEYDDEGWLRLDFTDGTICDIMSKYGEYTGESRGEYPCFITVSDTFEGLVEVTEEI